MKAFGKYLLAIVLFWAICFFGVIGGILAPIPVYTLLRKNGFKLILINIILVNIITPLFLFLPVNIISASIANVLVHLYGLPSGVALISAFVCWVLINKTETSDPRKISEVNTDELQTNSFIKNIETKPTKIDANKHQESKPPYIQEINIEESTAGPEIRKRKRAKKNKRYKVAIICISICLATSVGGNIFLYYDFNKKYSELEQEYQHSREVLREGIETRDDNLQYYRNKVKRLESDIKYAIDYVEGNLTDWRAEVDFRTYMSEYYDSGSSDFNTDKSDWRYYTDYYKNNHSSTN